MKKKILSELLWDENNFLCFKKLLFLGKKIFLKERERQRVLNLFIAQIYKNLLNISFVTQHLLSMCILFEKKSVVLLNQ